MLTSNSMLNLLIVLFCKDIDLGDIMLIDYLAYKYFVFYRFSLVGYTIWYVIIGVPPPPPNQLNLHLSEIKISKIDNY